MNVDIVFINIKIVEKKNVHLIQQIRLTIGRLK